MNFTQAPLPTDQYISKQASLKSQIVLHHTCSSPLSIEGDIAWWKETPERVATHFIVSATGEIFQTMPLSAWAFSLGIKVSNRTTIESRLVGIEIDNWGELTYNPKEKVYRTWTNKIVPDSEVCILDKPFRGIRYFQKYTDAQITAVENLINFLSKELNIKGEFSVAQMFEVNTRAFTGQNVLTSHASFREDKSDIYPMPAIIKMLNRIRLQ